MKFIADGYDIQDAINKALVVCPKKSTFDNMTTLYIKAVEGQDVAVCAVSMTDYIRAYIRADVLEEGAVMISRGEIEKVYKIDNLVTVEAHNDMFTMSNGKKRRTVHTYEMSSGTNETESNFLHWSIGKNDFSEIFLSCNCGDFLAALEKLKDFTGNDAKKLIYTGFHLNSARHMIEACNGYAAAWKRLDAGWYSNQDLILTHTILPMMKKIASTKRDKREDISFYIGEYGNMKLVKITGENYEYYTSRYEGEYINLEKSIGGLETNYLVTVDADDVSDVAQDFINSSQEALTKGVFVAADKQYGFAVAINASDFRGIEIVDGSNTSRAIDDRVIVRINPIYLKTAMDFFKKERVYISIKSNTAPIIITNEEDIYDVDDLAFILPARYHAVEIDTISGMFDDLISGR